MAHSIELLLDDHSDQAMRAQWQALADAGLPSQLRVKSATNRPHITLLAAAQISPDVDDVLRGLADRLPFACVIGAPLVFGGALDVGHRAGARGMTLARLIVPSAELLDLHAEVYRVARTHLTGDPFGHCRPGHWTAHATLGRRLGADEIGPALAAIGDCGDLSSRIVGLRRWDSDQRVDHILIS